jgi:hypothetical protein
MVDAMMRPYARDTVFIFMHFESMPFEATQPELLQFEPVQVDFVQFELRQIPEPSPPPIKEPPDGPENPDLPVREPDPEPFSI